MIFITLFITPFLFAFADYFRHLLMLLPLSLIRHYFSHDIFAHYFTAIFDSISFVSLFTPAIDDISLFAADAAMPYASRYERAAPPR
jgi:hypothetical protein